MSKLNNKDTITATHVAIIHTDSVTPKNLIAVGNHRRAIATAAAAVSGTQIANNNKGWALKHSSRFYPPRRILRVNTCNAAGDVKAVILVWATCCRLY